MNSSAGPLRGFDEARAHELNDLLKSRRVRPEAEAEAAVYALLDIAKSVDKVYSELIPTILSDPGAPMERLMDRIWDIREEFRHIAYHIQDGKLTEL